MYLCVLVPYKHIKDVFGGLGNWDLLPVYNHFHSFVVFFGLILADKLVFGAFGVPFSPLLG